MATPMCKYPTSHSFSGGARFLAVLQLLSKNRALNPEDIPPPQQRLQSRTLDSFRKHEFNKFQCLSPIKSTF